MKVAIALSGGVDSATSAYIIKKQGHSLLGITMVMIPKSFLDNPEREYKKEAFSYSKIINLNGEKVINPDKEIFSDESANDAAKVCMFLKIPHYIVDLRKIFKKNIIDYFSNEYCIGRTPNPCIMCNPIIKFGDLLKCSINLGTNYIATGHYVRKKLNPNTNMYQLIRGIDKKKDQGYFLYRLSQEQLKQSLFPLGTLEKNEVRQISNKAMLPVAKRKESQEICFIKDNDYIKFLCNNYQRPIKPGSIVHVSGKNLGKHKGLIYYTIGQRKRLGISHPKALYVVKIDPIKNRIIVGYDNDLLMKKCRISQISWISNHPPKDRQVFCKIRYRHKEVPAIIKIEKNKKIIVEFTEPQRAITPGQSTVFYSYPDNEVILGGGIIDEVI